MWDLLQTPQAQKAPGVCSGLGEPSLGWAGEGQEQGEIKANTDLKQLCLPERGNTRLSERGRQFQAPGFIVQV